METSNVINGYKVKNKNIKLSFNKTGYVNMRSLPQIKKT